jgi:hypothetical protein
MQVKCTSCGASQNINEAQNCDFCGNLIELESAKNNYQTFLNGESGNLMSMAETAIEATNWEEALQFFNRVLEKDITNSDAWLGKGIAIVYTSKIGDLKITEAIAYWKNALKHAPNQEAMGKRVAKEINEVVNKFYPSLENHFIQFKDLDNSYQELVSKFVTLEAAQDYAVQLDSSNIILSETGYALCKRVINIPNSIANSDYGGAIAGAIIGGLQGNKYTQGDAVNKGRKARDMQKEIQIASITVKALENKYFNQIRIIDPSHKIVVEFDKLSIKKEEKSEEIKKLNSLEMKYGPKSAIAGFILYVIILFLTNFFKGEKDQGAMIFWGLILFVLGPWILVNWLIRKNLLK